MAQKGKFCIYKGCDNAPGHTLFRFPTDKERFMIWAHNAALELTGDVDMRENRYLCDKHFSGNYINVQSRRKMLVTTAIPEKYSSIVKDPAATAASIKLIGNESQERKRKSQYMQKIPFKRPPQEQQNVSMSESGESVAVDETELMEQFVYEEEEEVFEIEKDSPSKIYAKPIEPSKIMNYLKPEVSNPKDESTYFLTDEGNITSTHVIESKTEEKRNSPLESYSEFIYNGEMYVQMPKHVYTSQMEKLTNEVEKYKNILRQMKFHIEKHLE